MAFGWRNAAALATAVAGPVAFATAATLAGAFGFYPVAAAIG